MSQPTQIVTDEKPYPPKFRALKHSAMMLLVVAVLLGGLWRWWSHTASTRLKARIAEIRARGEPLYPADFDLPPIQDDKNAATYLRRAIDNLNKSAEPPSSTALVPVPPYPPFDAPWHQLASKAISGNAESLNLSRTARSVHSVYWGNMPDGATLAGHNWYDNTRPIGRSRGLAYLLSDSALYAHLQGDDAEALERMRDLLYEAWALRQRPFFLDTLVSIGIDAMAVRDLAMMAGDLQITPASASASEYAVRQLIRQLLDDADIREATRFSILAERAWDLAQFDEARRTSAVLGPMLELDTIRSFDENRLLQQQAEQMSWMAAQKLQKQLLASGANQQDYVHMKSKELYAPDTFVQQAWRLIAMRRATAIALSIRLYRLDRSRWPTDLQELVPDFLPTLPLDPFSANDLPIQYVTIPNGLPDGSDRHLLLFGATNAGSPPTQPMYDWQRGAAQWRDLVIWAVPPATVPTSPVQ